MSKEASTIVIINFFLYIMIINFMTNEQVFSFPDVPILHWSVS